jgi:hypothetical protein
LGLRNNGDNSGRSFGTPGSTNKHLPDGDERVSFFGDGTFDLVESPFWASGASAHTSDRSLPISLTKGVPLISGCTFDCSVDYTVTVSKSVAKRLQLESTTVASLTGVEYIGGSIISGAPAHVPLTAAARAAFKSFTSIPVTIRTVARRLDDKLEFDPPTQNATLKLNSGGLH